MSDEADLARVRRALRSVPAGERIEAQQALERLAARLRDLPRDRSEEPTKEIPTP